ncbi:MAG: dolichyl-P-Man:Man(5)GlcNAc(2)-PP-dolichol alpha-1,3-mannosyltransferase [Watsoniomyces obsoletus]|nr:MAG: dolichyl-P-Man:Man(5)GlcNAc(2)-PP-dolichol alpha-1,3-mannosyltransferase [Watsoniomyces obsoletus]
MYLIDRLGRQFSRTVRVSDKPESVATERSPSRGTALHTPNRVQKRAVRRPSGLRAFFLRHEPVEEEEAEAVTDEANVKVKQEPSSDDIFTGDGHDGRESTAVSEDVPSTKLERPSPDGYESHATDPDTPMPSVEAPDDGEKVVSSDNRDSLQPPPDEGVSRKAAPSPVKKRRQGVKVPRPQRERLTRKNWSRDERKLHFFISRLGREPILPPAWKMDFPTLPYQVFTLSEEEAIVRALGGNQFRGARALERLARMGSQIRMATAVKKDPTNVTKDEIGRYIQWSQQDGGYHTKSFIPTLTITSPTRHQLKTLDDASLSRALEIDMQKKLLRLGQRWRETYRFKDDDNIDDLIPEETQPEPLAQKQIEKPMQYNSFGQVIQFPSTSPFPVTHLPTPPPLGPASPPRPASIKTTTTTMMKRGKKRIELHKCDAPTLYGLIIGYATIIVVTHNLASNPPPPIATLINPGISPRPTIPEAITCTTPGGTTTVTSPVSTSGGDAPGEGANGKRNEMEPTISGGKRKFNAVEINTPTSTPMQTQTPVIHVQSLLSYRKYGHDVWNALIIATVVCMARKYLVELGIPDQKEDNERQGEGEGDAMEE